MRTEQDIAKEKAYNKWVVVLSILVPVIVASLFRVKLPNVEPLTALPAIYASINAITAIVLIIAFIAIKNKNVVFHKRLMTLAVVLSALFLLMYVAYHMTSNSTPFEGKGLIKTIYYFILVTHIVLSVVVIPFVLITYVRGLTNNIERHKKIAKITFPLWLYVAISGVIVYVLISPYY